MLYISLYLFTLFLILNAAVVPLSQYNVNVQGPSSVSGLSSGAYFAVQMQVAFSKYFKGAGIFAGGPYDCAQGSVGTATSTCMTGLPAPNVNTLVNITKTRASSGVIDPLSYLSTDKVFMFSGTQDTTVKQPVMDALQQYYQNFIDKSQIVYNNNTKAAHTQPTDDPVNTNPCTLSTTPYISNCNYDGAGAALNQIYGTLQARNNGALSGTVINFNQTQFASNAKSISLDDSGYVFVPANCAAGAACTLHVSFHGCLQGAYTVGTKYVTNTGFNKWADTNNIIVLYPQAISSTALGNPNGCWDWWGYNTGAANNYDTKNGVQMAAIQKMIDWIGGKYNPISPPTNLVSSNVADTSVTLSWTVSQGATSYNIYRNSNKINTNAITTTSYSDSGLSTGTTYSYYATAVTSTGGESQPSNTLQVTTTGPPPPLNAPTGLTNTNATGTSLSFKWNSVNGASGYNFYNSGTKVGSTTTTTYTVNNLTPSTQYQSYVTATNGNGESAPSSTITSSTTSGWTCQQFNSSNYVHVTAGRAYDNKGYAYAKGSDQNMGLDNTFYTTVLAETSDNYYIIGTC